MKQSISRQEFKISRALRNARSKHASFVLWFTGLSGSGKSTLAGALEQKLFELGLNVYVLDGDNMRLGMNKDLDFSDAGRKENIRRVAEIAKLMMDAGIIVITSFISPFTEDRAIARGIIGADDFAEVFVNCPFGVCEKRDVKGLYARARKGEIKNFTGISSLYEAPQHPDITVNTNEMEVEECLEKIYNSIDKRIKS